jgi:hypothetical protein
MPRFPPASARQGANLRAEPNGYVKTADLLLDHRQHRHRAPPDPTTRVSVTSILQRGVMSIWRLCGWPNNGDYGNQRGKIQAKRAISPPTNAMMAAATAAQNVHSALRYNCRSRRAWRFPVHVASGMQTGVSAPGRALSRESHRHVVESLQRPRTPPAISPRRLYQTPWKNQAAFISP